MFSENLFFNKNIEELHDCACSVYLISTNGTILYCNDVQAKSIGQTKADDIIREISYDLFDANIAKNIRANDEKVILENKPSIILETGLLKEKICTYISYKIPLISYKNKMQCLFGLSIPLYKDKKTDDGSGNKTEFDPKFSEYVTDSINSYNILQHDYFTTLEKELLYCLLIGMNSDQIAHQLSLSVRTVEYYIANIKNKTGCNSKIELITKLLNA